MVEISNRPIPEKFRDKLLSVVKPEEILFVVVGDLNLNGKYADSMAVFLKDKVITFDECLDIEYKETKYSDIKRAKVKRLYGNAIFKVKNKNGTYDALLRFSYAAAEVADAGANFINTTNLNGYSDDEVEVVRAVYDKQRSFCPKCGRKLPKPNAECINCESKGKIINKFAKYIAPEKGSLIFCMILSVITTAMSLVPPYITKTLVDSVIPQHNRSGLLQIILLLIAVYVVQFAVNGLRAYKLRLTGNKIIMSIKKDIYAKAQYLPMSFYDKISTG